MIDFKKKLEEDERLDENSQEEDVFEEIIPIKKKRRFSNFLILLIVVSLVFSGKIIMSSPGASSWIDNNVFFNRLKHLAPSLDKKVKGEEDDRINILLLGMGGEGHDGAFLTDTIMLASLKPSTKEVSLISFPRDMVSPVNNWRKINSINAFAEMAESGSGGEKTISVMSELLQIDIPYYVRVDFNGFSKIIDEIGGIEIEVENSFTDNMYPIYGQEDNPNYYSRFEKLSFEKGLQKMDGSTALKYARSRHAFGLEGSDFARAKRQQLVLDAVKKKILSGGVLINPITLTKLVNQFNKNVSTNVEIWEMLRLWDLGKDIEKDKIINFVLNDAPNNYLVAGRGEDGAFILMPKTGNYNDIREMVKNIFPDKESIVEEKPAIKVSEKISEEVSVSVLNGTWTNGLAGQRAVVIKDRGFSVFETANAPVRDYSKTTVYDLSEGEKNKALKILLEAGEATQEKKLPDWVEEYKNASSVPDFILVMGTDANKNY